MAILDGRRASYLTYLLKVNVKLEPYSYDKIPERAHGPKVSHICLSKGNCISWLGYLARGVKLSPSCRSLLGSRTEATPVLPFIPHGVLCYAPINSDKDS